MKWYKFNINSLTEDCYCKWYNLMSTKKQSKVDKLHFDDDKKRSVCGDMLAKKAVAEFLNISAEEIKINTKENGKPYPADLNAEINISHSDAWVVCAVSQKPIGIDVEKIRPINLKIAKKFYTQEEIFYLFGHLPEEREFTEAKDYDVIKRFFEIWTGKEAYLKYTGEGITVSLNKLSYNKQNLHTEFFDDYVVSVYCEE